MRKSAQIPARRPLTLIITGFALFFATGCSHKGVDRPTGITPQRMEALAACYNMYVGRHQGRLPTDEASLKNFIHSDCKAVLAKHGISDPDSIFVSDRDKLPLVVTYSKKSPNRDVVPEMIIAREETGVGNNRLAVLASGVAREFDAATLAKIIQNAEK